MPSTIPAEHRILMLARAQDTRTRDKEKRVATVRDLHQQGLTNGLIARVTGLDPATVRAYLRG
jgi:DNA-binding NarL/FixJ family response regulator